MRAVQFALEWIRFVLVEAWLACRPRPRCCGCLGRIGEGELAAFVPAVGSELHPAAAAGAWCHHDCLAAHELEVTWRIEDVRGAGFTVRDDPRHERISLPRADRLDS